MADVRCADLVGELSAYLDGELEAERAEVVRRHLARCADCRQRYEREKALVGRLRRRTLPEAPADVGRRIHERLVQEDEAEGGGAASGS